MEQIRYEFVLQAQQPIAHHEETFGNTAVIMRRKTRTPAGWAHVPIVTGDAMRHGMREAASYAFLDAAGLLDVGNLSESALRLLFSGGQLTGSAGGAVNLDAYREMIDIVPPLALFGGCAQNRMTPGRLWVEEATLICREQQHILPEWCWKVASADGADVDTCRAHIELVQRVRMDPMLDPGKRKLLTAGDVEQVEHRLALSENASAMDDARAKEETKSSLMPRSFERVAVGSLFYWAVTATVYNDLERDTFQVACAAFLADARVGGKRGTGHGLLKAIAAQQVQLCRPADRAESMRPDQLSTSRVGELFRAHVKERSEKIQQWLQTVAA